MEEMAEGVDVQSHAPRGPGPPRRHWLAQTQKYHPDSDSGLHADAFAAAAAGAASAARVSLSSCVLAASALASSTFPSLWLLSCGMACSLTIRGPFVAHIF